MNISSQACNLIHNILYEVGTKYTGHNHRAWLLFSTATPEINDTEV